jgi:SAM-dependent methyltransferase
MSDAGDHLLRNRAFWNDLAGEYAVSAKAAWAQDEPTWGIFNVPEARLRLLPDLSGRDAVELGCGTAYVSAWMARRRARVVGLDNSPAQLATALRMQQRHGLRFPLLLAAAEEVPLPDARFDFAISEYGACLWADPDRWLPEAARLLRPGGELVFLTNSHLLDLCMPEDGKKAAGDRLLRSSFALGRMEWPDEPGVEFHLTHGEWIRRLRACGFRVEDLIEVRPPEDAVTRYPYVARDWARRWPCEEVWRARRL